jgi:hypothetical protein
MAQSCRSKPKKAIHLAGRSRQNGLRGFPTSPLILTPFRVTRMGPAPPRLRYSFVTKASHSVGH